MLISGSGSNLQAIIDAVNNDEINADIKAVISNRSDAVGLQRAAQAGIPGYTVSHKDYNSREQFDQAMIDIIDPLAPKLVVLAGFMRILSPLFITHYHHRLINIHPSLLPKYKGLNTHQLAIDNKDKQHGASVHYVDIELDSGPVVLQRKGPVLADERTTKLANR